MKLLAHTLLEKIIEVRKDALVKYASQQNANQFYIDKENALIQELCTIYNAVNELDFYSVWLKAEETMKIQMKNTHDNLDGHFIVFKRVENARIDRMSRIELDYFIRS